MIIALVILIGIIVLISMFMQQSKFGATPSGNRLKRIQNSPHYKDGKFRNLSFTPPLAEGVGYFKVMKEFFFNKNKRVKPATSLPSIKTDLSHIDGEKNGMVWFGHSSYFLQIDRKKIFVDPVLSGGASPLKFTTRSFKGTDIYTVHDIPEIDLLVITHDHWDHLDYNTVIQLKPKIKKIITGLGVGAHLEKWGFEKALIIETDWFEKVPIYEGFCFFAEPARHFSGRTFKRDGSLWMSFVFYTPTMRIYIGGDSGYDSHFAQIGKEHGPFDLAILENGQYNEYWKYIHMMPEEVVKAAEDLRAKKIIPVHWGKFALGLHAWDEPIIRVSREAEKKNLKIIYPMIGELVDLKEEKTYPKWWENIY